MIVFRNPIELKNLIDHVKSYGLIYLLVILHFFPGIINLFAILATSLWLLYYFVIRKQLDIYLLFLMLVPAIAFESSISNKDVQTSSNIFANYNSVIIIGPIAWSSRLALCFAIFLRILINIKKVRFPFLSGFWIVSVLLSIVGLFYGVLIGSENSSGLTVGFRIALSLGAVLVGKTFLFSEEYYKSLNKIVILSVLLLSAGLMSGHWFFVTFGFIPYFWWVVRPRILVLIPLFFSFNILFNLSSTITIVGVLLLSIVFFILAHIQVSYRYILQNKFVITGLIIMPLLITIYTLQLDPKGFYDLSTFKGYAEFKLLGDRKPVWDATFTLITNSFFIMPAGSSLEVYFDFMNKWEIWESGAHNIFLEIGKQLGGLGMVFLSSMLIALLCKAGWKIQTKQQTIIYYCFLSIYVVLGITGNSLIYDGVGAFYWFLLAQFYCVLETESIDSQMEGPRVLS